MVDQGLDLLFLITVVMLTDHLPDLQAEHGVRNVFVLVGMVGTVGIMVYKLPSVPFAFVVALLICVIIVVMWNN